MVLALTSRYTLAALQKGVHRLWRLFRAVAETGRAAGGNGNRVLAGSLPDTIVAAHPMQAAVKKSRVAEDQVQAAMLDVRG